VTNWSVHGGEVHVNAHAIRLPYIRRRRHGGTGGPGRLVRIDRSRGSRRECGDEAGPVARDNCPRARWGTGDWVPGTVSRGQSVGSRHPLPGTRSPRFLPASSLPPHP
jgi:hypothetical protein